MNSRTPALALVVVVCACTVRAPQTQVQWFKSGVYVGVMAGVADLGVSSAELEEDLADLGHLSNVDLDDSDLAYTFYAGYRFEQPFAIEVGYVNLGEIEASITTPSPLGPFVNDLDNVVPFLGEGYYIDARWYAIDTDRVHVGVGGGVWLWEAEVEAAGALGGFDLIDEDGIDPVLGINVLIDLTDRIQLRAEYDRYFFDDESADVLMVGLQFRLL